MVAIRKKLTVVGDGGCGKACLVVVSSKGHPPGGVPTVSDNYVADIEVSGKQVELALWDTAGQYDYDRLRPLSYADTHVIIVCFNIDSPDSLENIPENSATEVSHFCPNVPTIVLRNKKDMRDDQRTLLGKLATVTPEEGRAMAKKINACACVECSAITKDGVREVFETAMKAALKTKKTKKKCALL
ncbi:hypothetical protein HPB50_014606 [Hyalomma asiaticum]|uniref:Uncharacterized protein n=1 Tax=Hyalomma asiaticum TaxID=266040 RepID=A0ACB7TK38_HYAAI|nr:hypothetical protein HPB50_014606 [Hyalomma asiaticum]